MQNKVTNLDTPRKLLSIMGDVETNFIWMQQGIGLEYKLEYKPYSGYASKKYDGNVLWFPAFDLDDLLRALPKEIKLEECKCIWKCNGESECTLDFNLTISCCEEAISFGYFCSEGYAFKQHIVNSTDELTQAAADLLIWLDEQGYLK